MESLRRRRGEVKEISIISSISSLGLALVGTVWAIYFESLTHNASYVGFITTFFGIVGLIALILLTPIIEKNSKSKLLAIAFIAYILSYLLFYFLSTLTAAIILGAIISIFASLRWTVLGIILSDKSENNSLSKNVGFNYSLINLSWLIGPTVAGFIAQRLGIKSVFLIGAGLMIIALLLLRFLNIKDNRKEKKADKNFISLIKSFFKHKHLRKIYFVTGGISFWWAFIYTYMPIFIIESGKTDLLVGYFLSVIGLPLVFSEYFFGKIAQKKGIKKMFSRGYFILFLIPLACFLVNNFYVILGLLVLGSFGMAMLEPTTEAYFFDLTTKEQRDKYYGTYNTTIDVHYTLSLFLVAVVLYFLPFKFSFLLVSIVMLIFAIFSSKIKNIIEIRRRR